VPNKEDLERELDEVKRRFRSLMDNCVDAMIIINEDCTILDFNPAAEEKFSVHGGRNRWPERLNADAGARPVCP
jgi:PAS domain-containing protein